MKRILLLLLLTMCGPVHADEVPLTHEGGVYQVSGTVNGTLNLTFVVDSGAADVVLPQSAVNQLLGSGALSAADRLQDGVAVTADGSHVRTPRYTLKSVTVGGVTVEHVLAAVVPTSGEALLGQTFLEKLPYWNLDTGRGVLVVGNLNSHVADTGHMFGPATLSELNSRIDQIQQHSGREVLIATVPSFGSRSRDDLATLFTHGRDVSGLLILISPGDRRTEIKVGNGSRKIFTDAVIKELKAVMNAQFRTKNYDDGIKAGLAFIETHLGKH